jgi:hypothetical protein
LALDGGEWSHEYKGKFKNVFLKKLDKLTDDYKCDQIISFYIAFAIMQQV